MKPILFTQIPKIKIPAFFLSGRYDYVSSFDLVNNYYNQLEAPQKELIWFERSSHSPHIEEPDIFYNVMCKILDISLQI